MEDLFEKERYSSSVEVIDAAKAREYLAMNTNNRKLNKRFVDSYADQILKGQWQLNGESIVFDRKGHLLDGQHRLTAVILAGEKNPSASITTFVSRGVEDKCFETIDSGKTRSVSDVGGQLDIPNCNTVLSMARRILYWEAHNVRTTSRSIVHGAMLSKQDVLQKYFGDADFFQICYSNATHWYKSLHLLQVVEAGSFFYWLIKKKGHDQMLVFDFFEDLCTYEGKGNATVKLLQQKLIRDNSSHAKLQGSYRYAIIAKTWNAYLGGSELKQLRWNEEQEGPIDFL